jgi:Protein of unknown function (DUF1569)
MRAVRRIVERIRIARARGRSGLLATTKSRRALDFREWPAVIADVERLHRDGYEKAGGWDLARTCGHLADWMTYQLDGFPKSPLPIRVLIWTMGRLVGRRALRKALTARSMQAGAPTIPQSVPPPGGDEAEAVDRLRATIERFRTHAGPFHPSPFFGELDRETYNQLHQIHCAHHLSFLIPLSGA